MGVADPWVALQLDNAVALVGITIENASQELTNVGTKDKPDWKPKYSMAQLLDDDFRLPAPPKAEKPKSGIEALRALKGVKVWKG